MSEAKTEEATPRQEARARERGHAWQSRDLALGAVLVTTGGLSALGAGSTRDALLSLFTRGIDDLDGGTAPGEALSRSVLAGVALTLPLLLTIVAVGAIVSALQVGGLFAPGAIAPDTARLDPTERSASAMRMGSTFLLSAARFALVLAVAIGTIAEGLPGIATLSRRVPGAALDACLTMAGALTLRTGLALVAFGVLDAVVERALYRASIRMTRRERERERRDAEGDAHLRRERERVRSELHRGTDLDEARHAALVVRGDDLAIALAYDAEDLDAVPRVVAIVREDADALVREAGEHSVPRVIDDELATQLAIVTMGGPIPEALYEPVARAMKRGAAA